MRGKNAIMTYKFIKTFKSKIFSNKNLFPNFKHFKSRKKHGFFEFWASEKKILDAKHINILVKLKEHGSHSHSLKSYFEEIN